MKRKYKTLEELRAAARERARRWREKHRALHLERVKAVYGLAREAGFFQNPGEVSDEEMARLTAWMKQGPHLPPREMEPDRKGGEEVEVEM